MKRMLLSCAIAGALALSACVTAPQAMSTIDRVEMDYRIAKAAAEVVLPFATPERQAQVHQAEQIVDAAIAAARLATTIAEQNTQLVKAQAAMAVIASPAAPAPAAVPSPATTSG